MISPNQAWFFKYKPKIVDDFVFEDEEQKKIVTSWIENKRIDGNIILYGDVGLGKTSLAELLIYSIITNRADLYKMKSRSVKELDEEVVEFLSAKPISSNIKIVYIEEADKLHSQSFNALKDGLLENYLSNCIFIMCTNNIHKIPSAVRSRCTYKFQFKGKNRREIFERVENILKAENVEYDQSNLFKLISESTIGFRDLLNALQIDFISNGKITLSFLQEVKSLEEQVSDICLNILKTLLEMKDMAELRECYIQPINSSIGPDYTSLINIINNNIDLDFESICSILFEKFTYVPCKLIIGKYVNDFDNKIYPNIHFLSLIMELLNCIREMRL